MPKYAIRTAIVVGSGVAGWLHTSGVFDDDPVALPPPEVAAAALPQTVVMEEPVAPSLADAAPPRATLLPRLPRRLELRPGWHAHA